MELSVKALEKLLDYTVDFLVEPLLGGWKARREVRATLIRALGEAQAEQILAVGKAIAEAKAQEIRARAEAPPGAALRLETVDLDRRTERNLERRLGNIAAIVDKARAALPAGDVPDVEPDVAWTSSFSSGAQGVSLEEMQELWARVLAGEVARKGTTSVKALSVLRELDQGTAELFRRLCSMAITRTGDDSLVVDSFVLSPGGDPGMNALEKFGVSFVDLSVLNEHGLIFSSYKIGDDYTTSIAAQTPQGWQASQPFFYQGQEWVLIPERDPDQKFTVTGVLLSKAGREIANAIELETVPEYDQALKSYFTTHGLRMELVQSKSDAESDEL